MANWWEEAPLAEQQNNNGGNWWEEAPLAGQQKNTQPKQDNVQSQVDAILNGLNGNKAGSREFVTAVLKNNAKWDEYSGTWKDALGNNMALMGQGEITPPQQQEEAPQTLNNDDMAVYSGFLKNNREKTEQETLDNLPFGKKLLHDAKENYRLGINGATFGFGERLGAATKAADWGTHFPELNESELFQGNLKQRQQDLNGMRERQGITGTVSELVGGIFGAGKLLKGATMLPKIGGVANSVLNTAAKGGWRGYAAATGAGSGLGALDAYGRDNNVLEGALLGGIGGAVGKGLVDKVVMPFVSKTAGVFSKKPQIPTLEQLKTKASDLYNQADDMGVAFTPQGINNLSNNVKADLAEFGYHPQLQPRIGAALHEIDRLSSSNVTLKGMEQLRRITNNAAISTDPSERTIAGNIINKIDDFVTNAKDGEVLLGNNTQAAQLLKDARGMWKQVKKAEEITDMVERAGYRAGSSGAGGNADNATRQNLRRILEKGKGLTVDEKTALKNVVLGTRTQNALRLAGKLAPQGVISTAASVGGGTAMFGPVGGVALPIAGYAAKYTADKMTQRNTGKLLDIILAGGSKAATQKAPNAIQLLLQGKSPKINYHSSLLGALMGEKQDTPLLKALKGQ